MPEMSGMLCWHNNGEVVDQRLRKTLTCICFDLALKVFVLDCGLIFLGGRPADLP